MPTNSFGYVPTPALVAPIEFTLRRDDYAALGGHLDHVQAVSDVLNPEIRKVPQVGGQPDPRDRRHYRWAPKPGQAAE